MFLMLYIVVILLICVHILIYRVFEKIEERMKAIGQNITGFRKKVANWAKDVSLRGNINMENG